MDSINEVMEAVKAYCKEKTSDATYAFYIKDIKAVSFENSKTVTLELRSDFVMGIVSDRYTALLQDAFKAILGFDVDIRYVVAPPEDGVKPGDSENQMDEKSLPSGRYEFTFENFIKGPSNQFAFAAAQAVAANPSGAYNPLFIYGPSGLGKTHIMQSVGRAVQEQGGQARLAYLSAEDLASRYVAALRSNDVESFRARLRDLDVLLLEDVHFLQGKEKMQDMVLTVIKSLQDRGGRAIFTSSFSPRELEKLDSQLVSHFCSGIVSPLERPDTEMCRHILERKAKSFQVLLPDEVCDLLAGRLQGDVRQLESCLKSLVFKARMLNCGLNPELALEVLQQYATVDCGPDFASIVRLVCESYGLNERQLASRSHKQQYVLARNTIYYLARKHTDMSLKEIGERFNRRHSTVIKGITSLEREIANESRVGRQISRAVELIERNAGIRPEMSLAGKVPAARHAAPSLLSL